MSHEIQFGIGFLSGRTNVCQIINHTYKRLLSQLQKYEKPVKITIFILFDLSYQKDSQRRDFYEILPEVKQNINIKYITPEIIEQEKEKLVEQKILNDKEANLFLGYGYARARNTLLYNATINGIDYLLFWDDDEYPVACIQDESGAITWKQQDNILMHLKYIENADITFGHRCGYTSIIPYISLNKANKRKVKAYVEAIKNEFTTWKNAKTNLSKNKGITFADPKIAEGKKEYEIIAKKGNYKWISGSPLCINLKHLDAIPAFYNPEGARGEDAFFSICINNAKVLSVPVYHFHDPFLKHTSILENNYPSVLDEALPQDENTEQRFYLTSRGWIKYRPLYLYLTSPKHYKKEIKTTVKNLKIGIPEMNKLFPNKNFDILLSDLEEYDSNVEKDYQNYISVKEIWDKLRASLKNDTHTE